LAYGVISSSWSEINQRGKSREDGANLADGERTSSAKGPSGIPRSGAPGFKWSQEGITRQFNRRELQTSKLQKRRARGVRRTE